MDFFEDERTKLIFQYRFAPGVQGAVSISAHKIMHVLLAAETLYDVNVLGSIYRWQNLPDRYGLHVLRKWFVTFTWIEGVGARQLRLERR